MSEIVYCETVGRLHDEMARHAGGRAPRVLILPGFVTPENASRIQSVFASTTLRSGSSIYGSSALPLYEYRDESDACLDDYIKEASSLWLEHRQLLKASDDPITRLMTELSDVMDVDVRRLELRGEPCFFGQYRRFGVEDIEPHVDLIEREFPGMVPRPLQQWAVNISVYAPESGGELEVWDKVPTHEEYRCYGLNRPAGNPTVTFRPWVGDLYVFESRFVHAIRASSGPRCALAGFVGMWEDGQVRVWS